MANLNTSNMAFYFHRAVDFLQQYNYIFDFRLVDFFIEKPWTRLPQEWADYFARAKTVDLRGVMETDCDFVPSSLQEYYKACEKLSLPKKKGFSKEMSCLKGVTAKKRHEISQLCSFIFEHDYFLNVDVFVDVGCGLGHLDQSLALRNPDITFVAIDKNRSLINKARLRCKATEGCENVSFSTFTLTEKNYDDFINTVKTCSDMDNCLRPLNSDFLLNTPNPLRKKDGAVFKGLNKRAIVRGRSSTSYIHDTILFGLHTCADLAFNMTKMYAEQSIFDGLMVIPCCYHKLSRIDSSQFAAFPFSLTLQKIFTEKHYGLSQYALRVGAQKSAACWENQLQREQLTHMLNAGYRAVVEFVCKEKGWSLQRSSSLTVKSHKMKFKEYVDICVPLISGNGATSEEIISALNEAHERLEEFFRWIEPFASLQTAIQPVIESVLLKDLACFLLESGHSVEICQVFNDSLSPRCFAILSHRA